MRRIRGIGRIVRALLKPNLQLVEVQLRPGALDLLGQLAGQGHQLALWTASARSRVEFLKAQIPQLFEFFVSEDENRVFAAEDMEKAFQKVDLNESHFPRSVELHKNTSPAYSQKTPLVFSIMFPLWNGFDFLVDDSEETRGLFEVYGLGEKLISVNGQSAPLSHLVKAISQEIDRRIDGSDAGNPLVDSSEICDSKLVRRYLDPLYVKTLKRSLKIEPLHALHA